MPLATVNNSNPQMLSHLKTTALSFLMARYKAKISCIHLFFKIIPSLNE